MNDMNIGSSWKRWDLHVHTKNTNKNDQFKSKDFDEFCVTFFKKTIENNISAIGITDYFSIENYKKVKEFVSNIDTKDDFTENEKESIKNIFLLPNVELRMLPTTDKKKLVNIHCLFNPNYIDSLENDFFTSIEYAAGSGKKYKMNRQGMIDLGKELEPSIDGNTAYKKGMNNFVVTIGDLQKLLDENKKFRENTIIVVSNSNQDGASGLQKHYDMFEDESGSLDGVRQAIYKLSDLIFSGNEKDVDFFLGKKTNKEEVIKKCGSLKACIHGCDAHTEDKLFTPDKNRYCWIKSDTTFEGLKQIIFEPEYRVCIQETRPSSSIHKLEKVHLLFGESTRWGNDKFCFAGFKDEIVFSPNLTCIIGGRGSGKSTLLNLIAKKIGSTSDYLKDIKPLDIDLNVKFEPESIGDIEFLAQNTIEKFATDKKEFTNAIYTRLNKKSNNNLEDKENEIINKLEIFDQQIKLLKEQVQAISDLNEFKKDFSANKNIVKTFSDKVYLDNKTKLDDFQKKLNIINKSRDRYKKLYEEIELLTKDYISISDETNNYDNYYNELVGDINTLFKKFQEKDYTTDKALLETLYENILQQEKLIEKYLQDKGLNDENIQDAKNASQKLISLRTERENKLCELRTIKKSIKLFNINDINTNIEEFEVLIDKELESINQIFREITSKNPSEVKLIEVKYEPSNDIYKRVFDEFERVLDIRNQTSSTFWDYLKFISVDEALLLESGEALIKKIGERNTQAYRSIEQIFLEKTNFEIYKLLIEKEKRNISDNKILRVYYDNKPLDNSSFGQKCTAAIVILLSLGNTPIIIDEPEAHLDSSLIANYLVNLIKKQKEQRQIIFATHNANFVLNADAELIVKLENNDGATSVTNFTIEDLSHREDLLKLEGGREAFKKRELKYNI